MDAISSYIDHMFRSLPATDEVRRAKHELEQMSADRYHELRAEGVSENEAVGRVITQFGNLDELADELGIRAELDRSVAEPVRFSDGEAERFLAVQRQGAWLIAGGVLVALAGIGAVIGLGSRARVLEPGSPLRFDGEPLGILLFFLAIGIAVGMFIFAGVSMGRYTKNEGKTIALSPQALERYRQRREAGTARFALGIAGGVMTILLSVALVAVLGSMNVVEGGPIETTGVVVMLLGVGLGAGIIILTTMGRAALDRLTAEGDFAPEKVNDDELIGRIAGPYWMLALLVFLGWSFIGDAWDRSWIVWPIAGVLFGLVAATVGAFSRAGER